MAGGVENHLNIEEYKSDNLGAAINDFTVQSGEGSAMWLLTFRVTLGPGDPWGHGFTRAGGSDEEGWVRRRLDGSEFA